VHAAVTEKLPYDWLRDLAPVSIVTRFAPVMIIAPTLPARDLKEFIALLKANPGTYSFASSGTGTAVHLAEELFKQKAGVDILHVPYRGTAAAMPDLLSGRIAMMIDGVPVQTPNIRSGTVRALAVTTSTRSPALPDIPTMKEAGLDYEVPFWTAIYAPIATPTPVIARLASAIRKAMSDPNVVARLAKSERKPSALARPSSMRLRGNNSSFIAVLCRRTDPCWANRSDDNRWSSGEGARRPRVQRVRDNELLKAGAARAHDA
jgi:tripartite-type tricarboxylate transporter receptor subunit TctC